MSDVTTDQSLTAWPHAGVHGGGVVINDRSGHPVIEDALVWHPSKAPATLTCRGMTSKEIGRELSLSERMIEIYRARLLEKFQAITLAELVAKLSGMPL